MRKMKDSGIEWIGEIPEDWEVKKLNYCFNMIGSGTTPKSERDDYYNGDIHWLQSGDIHGMYITNTEKYINQNALNDFSALKVYKAPFIVIAMYGASIANTSIVKIDCCTNQACCVLSNLKNDISENYAYYSVITAKSELLLLSRGGTQPNISQDIIKQLRIPFPPLPEQQKIADFLDCKCSEIDSVISKTKSSIEEYKKLKQSIITEVVTGKVKIENGKVCGKYDTYKDSGIEWIGEIPSEWSVIRTKFISDSMSKGNGITKEQIVQNGDSPCVRYGEIYSKYNHSFSNCITKTNKSMYTNLQYFSYGDILFACTGELPEEIGKNIVYLGNEKCLAGGDIIVLSHFQEPRFLSYVYNSYGQTQKSCGKTKLKVVHISASEIANIFVALPPLSEQQQISDFLDKKCSEIDNLITKKELLVVELEAYKKSLIYEVVTGKRSV